VTTADDLLVAPAGAALLAVLEARHRGHPVGSGAIDGVEPRAVQEAVAHVAACTFGDLVGDAVDAAAVVVGPWTGDAPASAARALRDAPARAAIAEAVVARFGPRLDAQLDPAAQEWWWAPWGSLDLADARPLGGRHEPSTAWVTAPERTMWTVTAPPPEIHDALVDVWEIGPQVSRWALRPHPSARIREIRGPDDWSDLVAAFPLARRWRPNTGWELPGINAQPEPALLALPGQRAQRAHMRWFVEPDWDAAAAELDAVHLSWGALLTTEGTAIDLGDGDVAMLRNWCSERTAWLRPVLDVGAPLPPPALQGRTSAQGVDPATDPDRIALDRAWLARVLA
jgi:hypothetical protein